MTELREVSPLCNFTMLTHNLYELFLQYIMAGRKRAPPETELTDMLPTFQLGARTDRRALQSKFKSWAKRMLVENGTLKLASTNKEIIPLEKCSDIVMGLHFNGHKCVDKVISQIEEKYTWSKKNFGMDRFMVLNLISMNCSNSMCRYQIKKEVSKREENFIKNIITSSECHLQTLLQQNPTLVKESMMNSSIFTLPMIFPTSKAENFLPYKIQENKLLQKMEPITSNNINRSNLEITISKQSLPKVPALCCKRPRSTSTRSKSRSSSCAFRKPKYIYEFKALLSAAEKLSSAYPTILNETKTKFLGCLDLVPKKICSKRTLLKFEREKKRRKVLEKQHMAYLKTRKHLRDRNKLNKIKLKQQREKRAYLDVSGSKNSLLGLSGDNADEKVKNGEILDNEAQRAASDSDIEVVKVVTPTKELEIVQLTSSGDGQCLKRNLSDFKKNEQNCVIKDFKYSNEHNDKSIHCKSSLLSEVKQKDMISNQMFRKTTTKISPNTGSCNVKTKSQSQNSSNDYSIIQHPNLRKSLIPANIKGEIAVLPPSSGPPLSLFKQPRPSNIQEFKGKRIKPHGSSIKGKHIPYVLKPITDIKVPNKQNGNAFLSSCTISKLPADTNIFLLEKAENGDFKKVPCGPVSTNAAFLKSLNKPKTDQKVSKLMSPFRNTGLPTKWRILSVKKKANKADPLQVLDSKRKLMDEEMSKLTRWIKQMKLSMVHTVFQRNVNQTSNRLKSQLNIGISLVRSVRRKLCEIEKLEAIKERKIEET